MKLRRFTAVYRHGEYQATGEGVYFPDADNHDYNGKPQDCYFIKWADEGEVVAYTPEDEDFKHVALAWID